MRGTSPTWPRSGRPARGRSRARERALPLGALAQGPRRPLRLRGDRELAHRLEDLLDGLRLGRVGSIAGRRLLDERSSSSRLLERVGDPERRPPRSSRSAARGADPAAREAPGRGVGGRRLALDPSLLRALTEYEEHRLRESLRRGRRSAGRVDLRDPLLRGGPLAELTGGCASWASCSRPCRARRRAGSQIRFSLLVASDARGRECARRLDLPGRDPPVRAGSGRGARRAAEVAAEPAQTPPGRGASRGGDRAHPEAARPASSSRSSRSARPCASTSASSTS